jgi:hypothetical protein
VNYRERKRRGLRLGTALVEGTANFVAATRMVKSQQMRLTMNEAYNLLQV